MSSIQFISTSPEELLSAIVEGVKVQMEELKKDFQPKDPNQFLTRAETAKLLKIDLSTLHQWTKQKKLCSYGIGSRVYYKLSEVENALVRLKK